MKPQKNSLLKSFAEDCPLFPGRFLVVSCCSWREREREPCHHVYLLVQLFNTLLLWRVEAFNIIYIFTVKLKSPIAFKTLGFSQPKHFLLISDFYCFLSNVLFLNIDSIFYTDYTLNNEIKPNSFLTAIVYL